MTCAAGDEVYKDATSVDLDWIGRNAVLFEARLANTATAVKFPIVPGADDIIAIEPTFAEGAANMVAGI